MRSEVKKLLEGASSEELKSYIGQDQSVSLEELRVVFVEDLNFSQKGSSFCS